MDIDDFLGHATKMPKRERKLTPLEIVELDAKRRSESGDWQGSNGRTFVGLYSMCHRMIYEVEPMDLRNKKTFMSVCRVATDCFHKLFNDDPDDMASFIKWTWEREEGREQWAHQNSVDRKRLSPFRQFSASLVTEYRVDQKRRKNKHARQVH